jgi:carbon storage regulator
MIGDEIEITVVDVKKDLVRIGISAPRTITVHRKEVYDAIQAENLAAAQAQVADLDRIKTVFKQSGKAPAKPRRPQSK